jgi:hypothetical protein
VRDILAPKNADELKEMWESSLLDKADYAFRDSLVDEMMRKGADPLTWMRRRDEELGLYPDVDDPDFALRLYKKTEFASLSSKAVAEDTCTRSRQVFETTAVQRLVARFLHPSTPYRGLLLDHGVGVGKTCSAITVAETFLDIVPQNLVYILAPQAIADGFRRTIFDVEKLVPTSREERALTGDAWRSPQCTGMTYLRLSGTAAVEDKTTVEAEVAKIVRRRYKIMGYLAFANLIKAKKDAIPPHIVGAAREALFNDMLRKLFSDHLIIVDEAHNLRDMRGGDATDADDADAADGTAGSEAAEGKKLTPLLRQILENAEGLRLMLMTATPMYNIAPEILFLLNLLILNDTKDRSRELRAAEIFTGGALSAEGAELLTDAIRRYVSFMRGENPNTFPLRLRPPQAIDDDFMESYPTVSISRTEGDVTLNATEKAIMRNLPLVISAVDEENTVGERLRHYLSTYAAGEDGGPTEISDFILDQTMQMGNFTYGDEQKSFGGAGWDAHFKAHSETRAGGSKVLSFEWRGDGDVNDLFMGEGLYDHAPKIHTIVESVLSATGISFIYSRYVKAGALPIAIALECAGWCRVLADGTPAPLLRRRAGAPAPKNFYILLTSNQELSPNFAGLVSYATTFKNAAEANGAKVKAIIGSAVASEGLDLKCVREIHLLDGWYHLNRIEQITGRGVRFCSHVALPLEQRNCLVYMHAVAVPEYETADLYAYRLAVRKAIPIGQVTRLMKINAWDCLLNHEAIMLTEMGTRRITDAQGRVTEAYELEDRPYTSFCDYMDMCEYTCADSDRAPAAGTDTSTYIESDYRRTFAEIADRLARYFATEVAEPLGGIKAKFFRGIPWSMAAQGLRNMLGHLRIKRSDGIYGTLLYQNGYIVFQPDRVTDAEIPLALRYGRAYGRLPRTMVPTLGAVMKIAAPAVPAADAAAAAGAGAAVVVPAVAAPVAAESSLKSLTDWMTVVDAIVRTPVGKIAPYEGLTADVFNGWRWVLHHFSALPETRAIAAAWFMDNLWSGEERRAALAYWTVNRDPELPTKFYAEILRPVELFAAPDNKLRGYLVFDGAALEVKAYCMTSRDAEPNACSSEMMRFVEPLIGAAPDRMESSGEVFGFLVLDHGRVVYKTLHKPSAKGNLNGAQCATNSALTMHMPRILTTMEEIAKYAPTDPIRPLLLDVAKETLPSDKEKAARQGDVTKRFGGKDAPLDLLHLGDLTLKQLCPYTEFLLRYMELKKFGGKRWFFSLVDSARSGPKKIKMS